jgi:RNA polymerase sigma factor (sigma-70 family)
MSGGNGGSGGMHAYGGDSEVRFARLYERCDGPLRDYCRRRVDADAVDDVVADTFLTAWRCLDQVPEGDAALLWMYGVAYRAIGHQWRSSARRRRLHDRLRVLDPRPVSGVDELVGVSDERLVLVTLDRLGSTDAEVLRLVAWEQLSLAEVAAVLAIEPSATRQRLHRARRNFAHLYRRLQSDATLRPAVATGGVR